MDERHATIMLPVPETLEPKAAHQALSRVLIALEKAQRKFNPINSAHEGWSVIREEVHELRDAVNELVDRMDKRFWSGVRNDDIETVMTEATHVAAMGLRFLIDVPDCVGTIWKSPGVAEIKTDGALHVRIGDSVLPPVPYQQRIAELEKANIYLREQLEAQQKIVVNVTLDGREIARAVADGLPDAIEGRLSRERAADGGSFA